MDSVKSNRVSTGNRLFRRFYIDGRGRCPGRYLVRWPLLKFPKWMKSMDGAGIYLHKFYGSDWSEDFHDHPKTFISIGLWGSYVDEHYGEGFHYGEPVKVVRTRYRAPWIRRFGALHTHRLVVESPPVWTLVIVLPAWREWGFWTPTGWIPWYRYVKSDRADEATREGCK